MVLTMMINKDCIKTSTGITFNLYEPKPEMVNFNDIVNGLSKLCRFSGQISEFYSVAQHSVLVSEMIALTHPELALDALFHDAAEAYCGDLITPIKKDCFSYKTIEFAVMKVIGEKFGLKNLNSPLIKMADARMMATEKLYLCNCPEDEEWESIKDIKPYLIKIEDFWDHRKAKEMFVKRYNTLCDQRMVA